MSVGRDDGAAAAGGGHLEVLMWARENDFAWDGSTCASAAAEGHRGVLKWARANEYPWNAVTCAKAASETLEVLKWARANGCEWDATTCAKAAEGDTRMLRWARQRMPVGRSHASRRAYARLVRRDRPGVLRVAFPAAGRASLHPVRGKLARPRGSRVVAVREPCDALRGGRLGSIRERDGSEPGGEARVPRRAQTNSHESDVGS